MLELNVVTAIPVGAIMAFVGSAFSCEDCYVAPVPIA